MAIRVMKGETVIAAIENTACYGCHNGFGLSDSLPNTPGGFGYFLSYGRGAGFPPGERVKDCPETAEKMLENQPRNVNLGFGAVAFSPYSPACAADLVTALVNPDQLSTLIHIFCYEKAEYDNVIIPMSSGCASVVRIPLGELAKGDRARAVVGNADVFSRPHFPADSFFFTVPGKAFERMLAIAGESVIASPIWYGIRKRLNAAAGGK